MSRPVTDALQQVVAALKGGDVLLFLPDQACETLARSGAPVELPPGGLLCQAGDPGDAVFVVLEGEIEVRHVSLAGREVRLMALGPGRLAGEMAVLDGGPRSADMVASRRTRLWRIPRRALLEVLEAEPRTALALMAELSRRLRDANAALEARATLDLGGRLARLLLAEQNLRGLVALSQSEMARRVGASREKVNRKLREWADAGWAEVTPSGLRVLSAEPFERLAAGEHAR